MTSEEPAGRQAPPLEALADPAEAASPREDTDDPRRDRGRLNLTDPKAIRALAHPVRMALLEALGHAGTLTATQASEMLGESPANCAFHLRTLAKYGFVEEAGGGRGRERPWRQTYDGMSWRTRGDPQFSHAAEALDRVWIDRLLSRARHSLTSMTSWPEAFDEGLGASSSRIHVTPEEAKELHAEIMKTFERLVGAQRLFAERRDPKLRPPGSVPVEFVLLGYPILDAPPLPDADETDDDPEAGPAG
jgi:DNA-binding transcriptional ArsR family regulator